MYIRAWAVAFVWCARRTYTVSRIGDQMVYEKGLRDAIMVGCEMEETMICVLLYNLVYLCSHHYNNLPPLT